MDVPKWVQKSIVGPKSKICSLQHRGAVSCLQPFVDNPDNIAEAFGIVGVIVANAAKHLLPAQIESVLNGKNNMFEETRYMLPQAVAVNIRHLRPMYERAMQSA